MNTDPQAYAEGGLEGDPGDPQTYAGWDQNGDPIQITSAQELNLGPSAGPNPLAKIRADLISWGGAQDIVGQIDAGAPLGTVLSTLVSRRKSTTNSKNTSKLDPILAYARTAASAPEATSAVLGAPEVTEAQALARIRGDLSTWGGAPALIKDIDAGAPLATVRDALVQLRTTTTNPKNVKSLDPIWSYADGVLRQDNFEQGLPPPKPLPKFPEGQNTVSALEDVALPALGALLAPLTFGVINPWSIAAVSALGSGLGSLGSSALQGRPVDQSDALTRAAISAVAAGVTSGAGSYLSSAFPETSAAVSDFISGSYLSSAFPETSAAVSDFTSGAGSYLSSAFPETSAAVSNFLGGGATIPAEEAAAHIAAGNLVGLTAAEKTAGQALLNGGFQVPASALAAAAPSAATAATAGLEQVLVQGALPQAASAGLGAGLAGAVGGGALSSLLPGMLTPAPYTVTELPPVKASPEEVLVPGELAKSSPYTLADLAPFTPGMLTPAPYTVTAPSSFAVKPERPPEEVLVPGKLAKSSPYTVADLAPFTPGMLTPAPYTVTELPPVKASPERPPEEVLVPGELAKSSPYTLADLAPFTPGMLTPAPYTVTELPPVKASPERPPEEVLVPGELAKSSPYTLADLAPFTPGMLTPAPYTVTELPPVKASPDADKKLLTWSNLQTALQLAGLASGLGGLLGGGAGGAGSGGTGTMPGGAGTMPGNFTTDTLPTGTDIPAFGGGTAPADRAARTGADLGDIDWNRYGFGPEKSFFANVPQRAAKGGSMAVRRPSKSFAVQGAGDGRSDDIPAVLSDGEYVMDAETVALLGNGSNKAGAAQLDRFRANVRKHKGKELAKGRFSVKAKAPQAYMGGGRL